MTTEPNLNKPEQPASLTEVHVHVRTCWRRLAEHCQSGRCSCHLCAHGSANVLNGCAAGKMLYAEYREAIKSIQKLLIQRYKKNFPDSEHGLESGDFEQSITDEEFISIHGGAS